MLYCMWRALLMHCCVFTVIIALTCCRDTALGVTGVSHCSSNVKLSSSPALSELLKLFAAPLANSLSRSPVSF